MSNMQCRACLMIDTNMILFDEHNISSYNLLTGLNISISNHAPQYVCENCYRDLNFFIKFRDKCITSNSILCEKNIQHMNDDKNDVKHQIKCQNECGVDEIQIEQELQIKYEFDESIEDIYEDMVLNVDNETTTVDLNHKRKKWNNINKRNPVDKDKNILEDNCNYECGLCTENFEKEKLLEHIKSHENNNYCNVCSEYFREWPMLLVHRVAHLSKTQFACHMCFENFYYPTSLECHYINKHLANYKSLFTTCFECNKSFQSLQLLKKHKRAVHCDRNFQCNECSKVFKIKHQLKCHIKGCHSSTKKLHCDMCDYTSIYTSNMKEHKIRKHTSEKVYCELCRRVFDNTTMLEKHQKKCRKDPTICPICGKLLKINQRFSRHLLTHTSEGRYKCDRCPSTYKSKSGLAEHRNKHDGIRNKKCEYCPATFYSSSVLIKHRRVHTGVKPYVCKICQKGFTGNNNLKVHMRVHGEDLIDKKKSSEVPVGANLLPM